MTAARDLSKLGNQNALKVDTTNTRVGVNSTSPDSTLDVGGEIIVGSGASINTAGEAVFIGVVTSVGLHVSGSDITGVGTQGIDIAAKGLVIAGISTFYDDVLIKAGGLDVVGVITSNNKVVATGLDIGTAGVDIDGQTDLDELVVAGVATFSAAIDAYSIDLDGQADLDEVVVAGVSTFSAYPSIDADNEIQVGTAIQLGKAGFVTALGLDISTGGVDIDGQTNLDELVVAGVSTFSAAIDAYSIDLDGQADLDEVVVAGVATFSAAIDANSTSDFANTLNVSGGTFQIGTGVTIAAVAGFATFSSGVKLKSGDGGVLSEGISSVTAGFDNTSDLNLDNGMVHYTSDALAGNANTLNITSSAGINTSMAVNDMIVVTGITSVSSTSHYVNALTIDHNPPRQISWVGGAAPTEGGSTGFDTYTFTIWKTGNGGGGVTSGQFMVIANHTTTTA